MSSTVSRPVVQRVLVSMLLFFFFYYSGDHRDLHSFPTRRSSDLRRPGTGCSSGERAGGGGAGRLGGGCPARSPRDRKSTRLNSSHQISSYAVFCLKKNKLQASAANPSCRNRP